MVTPLITVKSNRWLSPSLNGLLISSEPLTEAAWRQARVQTDVLLQKRIDGKAEDRFSSLEFIAFLGERDPAPGNAPGQPIGQMKGPNLAIEQYPVEKIQMDGEVVSGLVENFPSGL